MSSKSKRNSSTKLRGKREPGNSRAKERRQWLPVRIVGEMVEHAVARSGPGDGLNRRGKFVIIE